MDNIIITNPEKIAVLKRKMIDDGVEKMLVVSDFDKTLTSCFVSGKKISSLISILRDEKYLTPDYPERAQALYNHYHPIEIDIDKSIAEKKAAMHEWWSKHYDLLVEAGLSKKDLQKVVESKNISLRSGALEFFDLLKKASVPLLILSSAGVGTETIALYLERFNRLTENIMIASNTFLWNDEGRAIGVAEPIIHTFNKDFTAVRQFPFFAKIKERRNIILLGDGLGDAEMLNGFEYDAVIKIGFLNENSKGELADFKEHFDIIILGDGTMDYIVDSFKKAFDVVVLNDGPLDYVNRLIADLVTAKL